MRSLTLGLSLSLALLAPGVAVAATVGGGGGAPVADEMLPAGVQVSHGRLAQAAHDTRVDEMRKAIDAGVESSDAVCPLSSLRSSVSARHGPPLLRGPPASSSS